MQTRTIEERAEGMGVGYWDNAAGGELPSFLRLTAAVAEFRCLDARFGLDEAANHHMVVSQVHSLLATILELESLGVAKETIHAAVAEVRRMHSHSPIIARMQTWPRGYAGDYETVEMILSGRCLSQKGTLAYHLERYVLDCPASQQHRNKVAVQADLIRSTITENPDAAVLVVACGGCPDLRMLFNELKTFRGQLWLNDIDKEALEHSVGRIATVLPHVKSVPGNVVELLRDAKSLPRFDLIVAGGLFDYLEDRVARFVIKGACSCLRTKGRFFFTNIGRNPYRPWMEYCGEWFLRERDDATLRSLAIESCMPAMSVQISQDTTGLTHLVEITEAR
jgi:extracellular factor (EF) 3-hydroxypalmitic acid methyl ester biosynthesis protein